MKIKQVTEVDITFDNGNRIYFDHDHDCMGGGLIMFKQLEDGQVVIDNRDEQTVHDSGPESRLQQLERRIKDLEYRIKPLLTTLNHFSVASSAACNAVRFAVGDAMSDVSEWRRFAEERGMEDSFNECVDSEESYTEGVAQFYINLGYRFERLQKEVRTNEDKVD